ncbi:MAG: sensor histidine kinase [Liquorilactobacillus nagelii]|jgi:signal transduction histidine kinase|uniref:sensor histidine kinase n=1 Tax=Liquorilactobacillus nagelii TaxID=82688 RepID=UPI0024325464|nr:sensor histidine kinase [Liquorilactobacillus nagelii]MCI1921331.1 sensor histidine kinase [Liquorilactobacillus nagelii]MCI1977339.1 sensor histidine kinase [Liquorilactobacillus nagelii]
MIRNKKFVVLMLVEQLPLLLAYGLLLSLIWVLIKLKEPITSLPQDLLRFSWLPFVIWIFWRCWRTYQSQQDLKQAWENEKLPAKNPGTAIAASYYQLLQLKVQQQREKNGQQRIQAAQRTDYLRLWSHEIKLPLTALKLAAENTSQVSSEEIITQIGLIQNQLDLMLNYERLADFHHDLTFEKFSLKDLLEDLLKENAVFFIDRKLRPTIDLKKDVQLTLDRKWLHFCLQQVIFNAIKYSSVGSELHLKWSKATLVIQDFGCGIKSNELPRIFEAGFTGENGRRQQAATGMGLYLVKQIAEKLELTIKVKSVISQGTEVYFIFPNNNNL